MSMECNWPVVEGKKVKPKVGVRPVVSCGKGRTKQSFKDRVNINKIIQKYQKTGLAEQLKVRDGVYMDVSRVGSLHESMEKVKYAEEQFLALPPAVRNRFQNSPLELVKFLENKENLDEAIELGLMDPKLAAKAAEKPKVTEEVKEEPEKAPEAPPAS